MKAIILLIVCFCVQQAKAMNINQGNWQLGGGISISRLPLSDYGSNSGETYVNSNADVQYFIREKIAVGSRISFTKYYGLTEFTLDPEATFYFGVAEKLAPFVTLMPIGISKVESVDLHYSTGLLLGVRYFLSDTVAIAPMIEYRHFWNRYYIPNATTNFVAMLTVHL